MKAIDFGPGQQTNVMSEGTAKVAPAAKGATIEAEVVETQAPTAESVETQAPTTQVPSEPQAPSETQVPSEMHVPGTAIVALETKAPKANDRHVNKISIKKVIATVAATAFLVAGGLAGQQWFQHLTTHEETDDAYITGHLHQVSTRVDGTVEEVLVDDNEHVKKGQVLVKLDPRDYQVKVEQALASLKQAEQQARTAQTSIEYQGTNAEGQDTNAQGSIANAIATISKSQASVREANASITAAQADLAAKEAELDRATKDYQRYDLLEKEGAVTTSQRDAAKRDYLVALQNRNAAKDTITAATERLAQAQEAVNTSKAQLTQAQGQLQLAKASAVQTRVSEHQLDVDLAAVSRAQTALDEAKLNLSYTTIVAPTSGRVGKKTVEEGQRIEPGQPLLTLVSDNPWVVANFKETQLKSIRAGQPVEIKIDSIPDHKFEGRVLSFSPASGASFAILPSDNATGNFTKIVQRLPVKILLTPQSTAGYEDRLAPGLSVIATVEVSNHKPERQPTETVHQVAHANY